MSEVPLKEVMEMRFSEMEKRVSLALAALETAHRHSRDSTAFWLSLTAVLISLGSLFAVYHK